MSLSEKTVDIDELAAALRRSPDYIRRNWLKMHRQHGMPRKNPTGWIWPRGAMEAWLEGAEAAEVTNLSSLVANQNRKLAERYAGGGRA